MSVSIEKAIKQALPVSLWLNVDRLFAFDASPDAVIHAASADWLLATRLDSFTPDGFLIVSRDHVRRVTTNRFLRFRKRVSQAERQWPRKATVPKVNLESATTILRFLQDLGKLAIVLRESRRAWDSIHCRIESVTEDQAILWGFDGEGVWEKRPKRIDSSEITQIRFGSRYLELYERHTK